MTQTADTPVPTSSFNLKAARINAGLSIAKFAEAIDVKESTYRRLEAGRQVSPEIAIKVAKHFKVKVTDLPAFAPIKEQAA